MITYAGCVGLVEKTGQFLDGSASGEKTIALYRSYNTEISVVEDKNKKSSIIISTNKFPMMKLLGSYPDNDNKFYFTSMEFLSGRPHGWNEYTLQLMGEGTLVLGETATFYGLSEIEPIQITTGKIHRFDSRIKGDEALTALRNRGERITALSQWMLSLDGPKAQTFKDFEKYWKPFLFPEVVSKKKRPDNWQQEGDKFLRVEDILWNTSYTQRVFPEELHQVRNSCTLLRDWEEALYWIYLEYEWENMINMFSNKIFLTKIK